MSTTHLRGPSPTRPGACPLRPRSAASPAWQPRLTGRPLLRLPRDLARGGRQWIGLSGACSWISQPQRAGTGLKQARRIRRSIGCSSRAVVAELGNGWRIERELTQGAE